MNLNFPQKNRLQIASLLGLLILFILSGCKTYPESSAQLSIQEDQTYQTMEGFGAFNTLSFWDHATYEEKYDLLAHDMGLSIMRFELPPTFQEEKGGDYNMNGKVFGGPDLQQNFKDVRELNKRGVEKFIATVWSPPAWMKTLNRQGEGPTTNYGGNLREDAREDFATYLAAYCRAFKDETGVELYALGIQNEPEFAQPFNSCVYNPEQLREALRYIGRKFRKEGIKTKIYLPEALPSQRHVEDFFNAVNEDEETKNYADIFAIHNYDKDGMSVGGAASKQWARYAEVAASVQPAKQLWMTETSGHKNNWEGAMLLAANIYNAINYGNINAWVWWAISDRKRSEVYGLIIDGEPTGRYYTSKHFYRYIRPGAIRTEAGSDHPDVLALAFKNSGNYKMVSVLINKGKTDEVIQLPKIGNTKTCEAFLSSGNVKFESQIINRSRRISLPSNSIMTVVWE
ncbi:MAG: glycoside hydrolase [Mariniphaga sp.]|nr:glycoside hydrolase [Mariniphaga sp.]MDD4424288.1 glycoside hydrolase [Mariniphaga sp.]